MNLSKNELEKTKNIRGLYAKKIIDTVNKIYDSFDISGTPKESLKKIKAREIEIEKQRQKLIFELKEKIKILLL